MIFKTIIPLLIIFIFISSVDSKCGPATTVLITTTDCPACNRLSTQQRDVVLTTLQTHPPTTIPFGTCKNFTGSSYNYGLEYFANGTLVPYSIELSEVKEIKIYSSKTDINAFTVTYTDGSIVDIGNTLNINIKSFGLCVY